MSEEEAAGASEQAEETTPPEPGADAAVPEGAERSEEYRQSLIRLKADFDNYRRRTAQDQARWSEAAVGAFVVQLLPVVDNLERAAAAGGDGEAVRRGVELTLRQLAAVLADAGVTPLEAVGQPFDPALHEAVARGPAAGSAPGSVAEEYRKGYLLKGQVLRPAMVRVAEEAPAASEDGGGAATEPAKEGER